MRDERRWVQAQGRAGLEQPALFVFGELTVARGVAQRGALVDDARDGTGGHRDVEAHLRLHVLLGRHVRGREAGQRGGAARSEQRRRRES